VCGLQLYKAFLKPNVDGYVLLVALAPAIVSLALAVFIRPFPIDDADSSGDGRFHMSYVSNLPEDFFEISLKGAASVSNSVLDCQMLLSVQECR
jgi:hypothetical protein